jgi:HEAT repeat protein
LKRQKGGCVLTIVKRLVCVVLLASCLGGCGKTEPVRSGGRTASYWMQALREPDISLRRKAAVKLGPLVLTDEAALQALLAALRDADPEVRSGAAWALGTFCGPRAADVIGELRSLQQDPDARVRAAVVKAIGRLSGGQT